MFVQFRREADQWVHVGISHVEHPDADVANVSVTKEEYIQWIENPSLFRRYEVVNEGGDYALTLISEKRKLADMVLEPMKADDETVHDVLIVLTDKTILVHMFNSKMAQDPKVKIEYYATEADNHSIPVFEIEAAGVDTVLTDVEFDPRNIRVVVRDPIEDITYGLKIT